MEANDGTLPVKGSARQLQGVWNPANLDLGCKALEDASGSRLELAEDAGKRFEGRRERLIQATNHCDYRLSAGRSPLLRSDLYEFWRCDWAVIKARRGQIESRREVEESFQKRLTSD